MPSLPDFIIRPPHQPPIYYSGSPLKEGIKPAVIFFALSAEASLYEDPFNQPVVFLTQQGFRVFSWDLPFHGPTLSHHEAMHKWAIELLRNPSFLLDFIRTCHYQIQYLINHGWVDPAHLAVAGLSRGAFIATHLAAQHKQIKTILGFAPLTQIPIDSTASSHPIYEEIGLIQIVDQLTHAHVRFYIGNHDTRVGTDACYAFIRALTQQAIDKGRRSPPIELIIYPSIGFKGHGTPPHIFQDGARWLIERQRELL